MRRVIKTKGNDAALNPVTATVANDEGISDLTKAIQRLIPRNPKR